uniref:EF-hand domain-containing protein n=1 Tax=Chromera velia CCMP2878 TaxID=1169474 RepID=A0A0G4GGE8_9ALVE|eukprot:Cvel_21779.t1-p1 / transcript=Cvel_21779.t1 / gene=Cvel_21779 / organism=Chromera_velia_CCMP2878 / gene_product=hypothetical protein / transcript_product=hypothetical protein / location=Cvel_scaffold2073:447-5233(-) / protein_length=324 / sequence_SO=supercontig / SO=protein_coding / is_pseudo=false
MCSYSGDWQQELRKFFAFVADEEHWLEELRRSLCASEHFDVFEHFVILDKDGKGFLNPEDFVDFLQRYDPDICDKCGSNNIFYRFLEAVVCNDPNLRWLVEQRCCYSSSCVCPCPEESAAIATLLLREVELEEALETWRQRIFCLLGGAAGLYKAFRYFDVRVEGVITSGGLISLFSRHTGTEVTSRDVRGLFHRFDRRRTPSGKRPRDGGRLTLEDFLAALLPAETDREAALQEVASAQAREKMKGMRGRGGGGANGAGGPDVLLVDTEPRDRATREDALIQSMVATGNRGRGYNDGPDRNKQGEEQSPLKEPLCPPPLQQLP